MNFAGTFLDMNPVDVTKAFGPGNAFAGLGNQQNYILPDRSMSSLTAQLPPKQNPFEPKKGRTLEEILVEHLDPANQQRQLENASMFQERQMRTALPYNLLSKGLDTLSKLPEQISGRAADRAMNIVLGARTATDAFNQAASYYPRTAYQSTASPAQRDYIT